ncbi:MULTISPECIES: DUF1501 domain-containing protein [Gimesia]|uniref:Uncharacterized protein n=2 Tax=Gimesia TaxID=1649453 RepID=A0A517WFW4_9PLAN|nr:MULTISPECIES: DUF1501 domain-containing protein [Gimesia]MCR9234641.1 DUF1501 domain-containing protein [bacterium]KAA0141474.1 DUF1501 domain-containing protein [Gimesia chilikensis]QDT22140.1 hypothetical protein HG66A1_39470 [Gimesia chilikensis]QDT86069.1 hypothetical protein MalM14_37430 [Gimesia chilikensis]QDU04159.1 hypothetical protein V6x_38860 [Gimesia chilikensis]
MLKFTGKGTAHTCSGVTRRDFLQVGTLGAMGLSLPQYLEAKERGMVDKKNDNRAAIMIFNLGAPSQLDTFDMKPEAPSEIRGPFKPIDTASPDINISEIFPLHARVADKFSLVRSCYHTAAAVHDAGWQMMQTGRLFTGGINTPHIGSVVDYLRGRKTDLPANVVLPETMGRGGGNLPNGQAGGFLGKAHDPFALMADPSKPNFKVPDMLPPQEIGSARLERRRKIRDVVDSTIDHFESTEDAKLLNGNFHSAYRLMTSKEAREAFDLSKEPMKVRERYGMNRFGQCCLLSRRLVEAGVRFVTINTFLTVFNEITWDIHGSKPFTSIEGMKNIVAPMYDQAYSALIEDLYDRGMLDETLVCNVAEFGRTPKVNPAGGRDHWPQCFTCYFAGGGVQGGRVVGSSDPIGGVPADRPVSPGDLAATVYHSLGFDLHTVLPGPAGRPFPLVDVGKQEIRELF